MFVPEFVCRLSRITHLVYVLLLVLQVEGEELEVLRGLDDACWARVQQIALEVHDCIDGEL
jgi:hypothetical protein